MYQNLHVSPGNEDEKWGAFILYKEEKRFKLWDMGYKETINV